MEPDLSALAVRIFADGADLPGMRQLSADPLIKGFTTNPTLMRKAGVRSYEAFARDVLAVVGGRPVSFEVLCDDVSTMVEQGRTIGRWGDNVYVKIPVTDTRGGSALDAAGTLHDEGVKVNVTAVLTLEQVEAAARRLTGPVPSVVSVFAGRIADTGRDPVPVMAEAAAIVHAQPSIELLWASPRELLNIFHAESAGCDIITATADVLAKRHLVGKPLAEYSLETVRMFSDDARGVDLEVDEVAGPGRQPGLVRVPG